MKYFLLTVLNVMTGFCFAQISLSQHTFSATSQSFSNSSLLIDYTWGEMMAVTTITSPQFIFTQGLHQPDKFTVGINEKSSIFTSITVYPNPFHNLITIDYEPIVPGEIRFELRDACGRIVYESPIVKSYLGKNQVSISTNELASGYYLLHQIPIHDEHRRGAIPVVKY